MDLPLIIKNLRMAKGLSQRELAKAFNIAPSTIAMYETGQRSPDTDTIKIIADYFNVSTDFLLGRTNNDTISTTDVNQSFPSWATSKDKRDFKKMLEEDSDLMFDGIPIDDEDRQRVKDVLTGLFWEAKQMNKRKKKSDSTNDTKK
jgi:transcriptional regulator with XRE-family HTH domain